MSIVENAKAVRWASGVPGSWEDSRPSRGLLQAR